MNSNTLHNTYNITLHSLVSSPGWLPDPFLRVFTRNIHRGKHGSDQEVYDHEGRFIPQVCVVGSCGFGVVLIHSRGTTQTLQRFEDIFSKWDHEGKGAFAFWGLSIWVFVG